MTSVTDIEKAVAELPPGDLALFRAWFEAFDAERFDRRIAADTENGRLDALAEEAMAEHAVGRTRKV